MVFISYQVLYILFNNNIIKNCSKININEKIDDNCQKYIERLSYPNKFLDNFLIPTFIIFFWLLFFNSIFIIYKYNKNKK
jgi:hypothetical protein